MRDKKQVHYAWAVCAGCAILLFCTSGLSINAFSIYQPYIIKANGFSNSQSSLIIMFRNLFSLASMLTARKLYSKISLRTGMFAAGLAAVTSFVLYGLASNFALYAVASSLMGISYGLGTMIPITILLKKWFFEKRGTAIGLCSASTGISTLGIPSLISWSVNRFGLRNTFLAEAAAVLILVTVSFILIRNTPEDRHTLPYGTADQTQVSRPDRIGTDSLDRGFLLVMILLIGAAMNVSYSHLTVLMTGEGISEAVAAKAISVSGISLTLGKIIYGRLGDSISNRKTNYIFGILFILGTVLCCFVGKGTVVLYTSMVIYSTGMAYMSVGLSAWAGDLASDRQYDRTVQMFQACYAAGSLVFSPLPGMIADRNEGSYVPAFAMFAVMAVLILLSIQLIYRRSAKKNKKN